MSSSSHLTLSVAGPGPSWSPSDLVAGGATAAKAAVEVVADEEGEVAEESEAEAVRDAEAEEGEDKDFCERVLVVMFSAVAGVGVVGVGGLDGVVAGVAACLVPSDLGAPGAVWSGEGGCCTN